MLHTVGKVHGGQAASAIGFLVYLAGAALGLSDGVLCGILLIFSAVAVWTLASILTYPGERRKRELSYNVVWGQSAVTVLLVACAALTVRDLVGR